MGLESEARLLPHHTIDFIARRILGQRHFDIQEKIDEHNQRLSVGIAESDHSVRIPSNHPLYRESGNWIPYTTDINGESPDFVNTIKRGDAFSEFFVGNPDEKVWIGLDPDKVCASCVFGFHCLEEFKNRKKGKSQDNLYLESFYAWHELTLLLDPEIARRPLDIDMNLKCWISGLAEFQELFKKGEIEFVFKEGRVSSIGIKRGVLIENLIQVGIFFNSPGSLLLWHSRNKNLLTKMRGIVHEEKLKEMLDIVSAMEYLSNKILWQTN